MNIFVSESNIEKEINLAKQELILFDGVCNLCNSSVDFVIRRDKKVNFKFTSLQSEIGQEILKKYQLPTDKFETLILLKNGKIYRKSTAALKIARKLSGFWFLLYGFIIIPAFLRNLGYDFIAKNRYRFFGKKETCRIPTPEERSRFL